MYMMYDNDQELTPQARTITSIGNRCVVEELHEFFLLMYWIILYFNF